MNAQIDARLYAAAEAHDLYATAVAILAEHGIDLDDRALRHLKFLSAVGVHATLNPVARLCEAVEVAA
jgi:membrane-anchored protein YejM (alkaline phosphatase superfamily)